MIIIFLNFSVIYLQKRRQVNKWKKQVKQRWREMKENFLSLW